jgi:hypothetical protein
VFLVPSAQIGIVFALLATAGVANCMALPAVSLILPVFKDKAVAMYKNQKMLKNY